MLCNLFGQQFFNTERNILNFILNKKDMLNIWGKPPREDRWGWGACLGFQ